MAIANGTVMINRKNLSATVLLVGNATVNVAGNSTTSDLAVGDEVITGGYITQVWCGSPSGNGAYWSVKRGANLVSVFDSTAYLDFAGNGNPIKLDPTATLVANLVGSTAGTLIVEIQKQGTMPTAYAQNN